MQTKWPVVSGFGSKFFFLSLIETRHQEVGQILQWRLYKVVCAGGLSPQIVPSLAIKKCASHQDLLAFLVSLSQTGLDFPELVLNFFFNKPFTKKYKRDFFFSNKERKSNNNQIRQQIMISFIILKEYNQAVPERKQAFKPPLCYLQENFGFMLFINYGFELLLCSNINNI